MTSRRMKAPGFVGVTGTLMPSVSIGGGRAGSGAWSSQLGWPIITAPAVFILATQAASSGDRRPAWIGGSNSVGKSEVSMMSLTPIGIPWSGLPGLVASAELVAFNVSALSRCA